MRKQLRYTPAVGGNCFAYLEKISEHMGYVASEPFENFG